MVLLEMVLKTIFFYFFVAIAYRLMGKREVGQLGVIDLIVTILIAELVAISISDETPMMNAIGPIVALVVLEISLAYLSIKSKRARRLLGGKPSLIINNGLINYQEMIKQRYNLDDLLMSLRSKEIKSIEEVEYAILELDGSLSIFKKNDNSYPMPLIIEGVIQDRTLKEVYKTKKWLCDLLVKKKVLLCDIFYAFYRNGRLFIIKNNELNK